MGHSEATEDGTLANHGLAQGEMRIVRRLVDRVVAVVRERTQITHGGGPGRPYVFIRKLCSKICGHKHRVSYKIALMDLTLQNAYNPNHGVREPSKQVRNEPLKGGKHWWHHQLLWCATTGELPTNRSTPLEDWTVDYLGPIAKDHRTPTQCKQAPYCVHVADKGRDGNNDDHNRS